MAKNKTKNKTKNDDAILKVDLMPQLKSRQEVLSILAEAIDKQHDKVTKGRIFNPENEKIKINMWKSLVHTCHTYNQILKDMQLDEIKYELQEIRNAMIYQEKTDDEINENLDKVSQTLKLLDGKVDIDDNEYNE